jgi:hypothetical protein
MALNSTTLSAALDIYKTSFGVASATGIVAPTYSSGTALQTGISYALCEQEVMQVTGLSGTVVSVLRGQYGTSASAHAASTPIVFGLALDFPVFTPAVSTSTDSNPQRFTTFATTLAGAATNVAPGAYFHLTGTVAMVTLTPPTGFVGGEITIVFDGSAAGLTWTAAGNIAVAGTATTALSAVTFYFDPNTSKWYPSRLA